MRPSGIAAFSFASNAGSCIVERLIGVATAPGPTPTTQMPCGALLDETALVEALLDGHIAHAALDVFETEPLPVDEPLRSVPNVWFWESPRAWLAIHRGTRMRLSVLGISEWMGRLLVEECRSPPARRK